jgi:hypothetical protein
VVWVWNLFPDIKWDPKQEKIVKSVKLERIRKVLNEGKDVIVDNTHMNPRTLTSMQEWFKQEYPEVDVIVWDFRHIPIETCIERDSKREGKEKVGVGVIMKMAKEGGLIPEVEPYPVDPKLPCCIICDLDGTLALFGNRRNPYDASKCDETDEPNQAVLDVLKTYENISSEGYGFPNVDKVFFFSGRKEKDKEPTLKFLDKKCELYVGECCNFYQLVMRKDNDERHDAVVKKEFFDEYIHGKYNVAFIFDDRPKIVRMWKSLGLPVFNVGDGEEF